MVGLLNFAWTGKILNLVDDEKLSVCIGMSREPLNRNDNEMLSKQKWDVVNIKI